MARRPQSLRFSNSERPPFPLLISMAIQHASFALIYLVPAVVVAKASGFTPAQQAVFVTGTIFCCGVSALLLAGSRRFGSGLLSLPVAAPMFIGVLIQAGSRGGPEFIATVVLLYGLVQLVMAPLIYRARSFFPPEVCGVVTAVLGLTIAQTAMGQLGDLHPFFGPGSPATADEVVGLVTLVAIAASTVWLPGYWRSFGMLAGCFVGYVFSVVLQGWGPPDTVAVTAPLFTWPQFVLPSLRFDAELLPSVVMICIANTVYGMGIMISTDRLEDADWVRPNVPQLSRGTFGLGIGNLLSCFLGGTTICLTALSTALAYSSGVTSRSVGIVAGVLLVALSFFGESTKFLMALPPGVLAGLLGYVAIYLVASGFQLALSRMMSPRRMLVIGLPVCAGVYALSSVGQGGDAHGIAAAIRQSPLAVTAFFAITVNMLMRIGIAQQSTKEFGASSSYDSILQHFQELGERWGLRNNAVVQAANVTSEMLEAIGDLATAPVSLTVRHDEMKLDLIFRYRGDALTLPDAMPSGDHMIADHDAVRHMSFWIVRKVAEGVRSRHADGTTKVEVSLAC